VIRETSYGSRLKLAAPDKATLWHACRRACDAGLPCHLWIENGEVTALGIGPAERCRIKPITQRFKLYGAALPHGRELNDGAIPMCPSPSGKAAEL
jgi:hypothetical protein